MLATYSLQKNALSDLFTKKKASPTPKPPKPEAPQFSKKGRIEANIEDIQIPEDKIYSMLPESQNIATEEPEKLVDDEGYQVAPKAKFPYFYRVYFIFDNFFLLSKSIDQSSYTIKYDSLEFLHKEKEFIDFQHFIVECKPNEKCQYVTMIKNRF